MKSTILFFAFVNVILFTACKKEGENDGFYYGKVIERNTTIPVANASISLYTSDASSNFEQYVCYETSSDGNGEFKIPKAVKAGTIDVCANDGLHYCDWNVTAVQYHPESSNFHLETIPYSWIKISTQDIGDPNPEVLTVWTEREFMGFPGTWEDITGPDDFFLGRMHGATSYIFDYRVVYSPGVYDSYSVMVDFIPPIDTLELVLTY